MATATIFGTHIAGIASAVPEMVATVEDTISVFGEEIAQKISKNTGVRNRHVSSTTICTSDLCEAAAKQLLKDLKWSSDSIDLLIFVSQTPDHQLPATSCLLQGKLGLGKHCAAFDINLGCSGYVYGLWIAGQLLTSGSFRRGLLLVGDTISRTLSPTDRTTSPLFGDAGTATALEYNVNVSPMHFELGTDGSYASHLIIPAGGYRKPHTSETSRRIEREGGNTRSDEDLYMNGTEIFTFTLREVPPMLASVMNASTWDINTVDAFVLHQANQFILNHLSKRMKLPSEKVPQSIENFGNTSSASIPITITECLGNRLRSEKLRLVLGGFGVGFSWAAAAITCGPMVISEQVTVVG